MIFSDIYNQKWNAIDHEFEKLVDLAYINQTHKGDLLLISLNAHYDPEISKWDGCNKKFEPFRIGNSAERRSENLHFKFIDNYRQTTIAKFTFDEYKEKIKYHPSRESDIKNLEELEEMSIQLEMLIYLKIWEADSLIRRFYQIARLIHQEPYDWFFRLPKEPGDKNATGTRQEIIRNKIRDKLKSQFPNIYTSIKIAYVPQLRNSIAHSNYSFLGRYIHPNNIDKHSNIKSLPFDDWIEKFHETLAFYNGYIKMINAIETIYHEKIKIDKKIEVRRIEQKKIEEINFRNLELDVERGIWNFEEP